jgi:integrase
LWHLVLKQETASGLCKETIRKVEDVSNKPFCPLYKETITESVQVIALVAQEKELELTGRPKKNMYIENVAEFTRVLLTTMEMTFACGWQRIQMLFFCQLAAYTASRPGALLHLRYQDIGLKLIRDPEGGQPRLFIFLKPDFTKRFLRKKAL